VGVEGGRVAGAPGLYVFAASLLGAIVITNWADPGANHERQASKRRTPECQGSASLPLGCLLVYLPDYGNSGRGNWG
jgi:hypothetical protein